MEKTYPKGQCYACGRTDVARPMLFRDGVLIHEGVCSVCAPYLKELFEEVWGRFRWELFSVIDMRQLIGLGKHIVGIPTVDDFKKAEAAGFPEQMLKELAQHDTDLSGVEGSLEGRSEDEKFSVFRCLLQISGIRAHHRPIYNVPTMKNEDFMPIMEDDRIFFDRDNDLLRDYNRMTASYIIRRIREYQVKKNYSYVHPVVEVRKLYVEATKRGLAQTQQFFFRAFKEREDRRWSAFAVDFTIPSEKMIEEIIPTAQDLVEKFSPAGEEPLY